MFADRTNDPEIHTQGGTQMQETQESIVLSRKLVLSQETIRKMTPDGFPPFPPSDPLPPSTIKCVPHTINPLVCLAAN